MSGSLNRFKFAIVAFLLAWSGCVVSACAIARAAEIRLRLTVSAGEHVRRQTPVRVPLRLPAAMRQVTLLDAAGQKTPAQMTRPALLAETEQPDAAGEPRELWFILAALDAGAEATFEATFSDLPEVASVDESTGFQWRDTPGDYAELRYGERPVLHYMYRSLDESSPANRELTYKVYHHLFDPTGKRLLTKGPGGQYTHHRGLFYGFNRVSFCGDQQADTWHCAGDAYQSHESFVASESGPVLGRHRLRVGWHGPGKIAFADEERELTVYNVPGGQLVEFTSRLATRVGPIQLDGDPQHAGFHFRASNEVAEGAPSQTWFLRTSGPGLPGEARNWPEDKQQVNLPWNAMSFVVGGVRYTAAYLDHPDNPKESRYSERAYGRFGSYFEYEVTPERPLAVKYRLWLREGEMTAPEVAAQSTDFVAPLTVHVEGAGS